MGSADVVTSRLRILDWTYRPPKFEFERLERTKLFSARRGYRSEVKYPPFGEWDLYRMFKGRSASATGMILTVKTRMPKF